MKKKKKQKKKFYYIAKITTIRLTSNRDIQLQGTCTATATCDGPQRPAENPAPTESDGSCVCCKSLKAIAGNNRNAHRTRANPPQNDKHIYKSCVS